ncbi:MAG: aminomethyl-transferring glycine dehydrogenase subunit GcvPA [Muribaculaceae bacterium]|nr:aminomethyl-transferring glycine dehydrogenase subunit GcvPA [Muribaculaceae bacterium]
MRFFPHTDDDIRYMLDVVGLPSLEKLFESLPKEVVMSEDYDLPEAMSEKEVRDFFDALGKKNRRLTCFAGAGCYDHYSPAVINSIVSRSEFLTSYTPYQAEISQGTLQYIFEYQSMISALTGMEVSNASMYDGATATAEAVMMAVAAAKKRRRVLISSTVNPAVAEVVKTYARHQDIRIDFIKADDGVTSHDDFKRMLNEGDVAGVVVSQPNFYGIVENFDGVADECHDAKSLLIMNCVASTLGALKSPAEWGADIAVGDGQSLGVPMSFGGPFVGFLATRKSLIRKMPGRIVGATRDADGKRAFVLTLQAREQHIRREKATSNICSNQSLMALYVTIYLSLMGPEGLREVNDISAANAHLLAQKLTATGKASLLFPDKPFLNEFALRLNFDADTLLSRAADEGILAGVKLDDNTLLVAATEMQNDADIDKYIEIVNNL